MRLLVRSLAKLLYVCYIHVAWKNENYNYGAINKSSCLEVLKMWESGRFNIII